MPTLEITIQRQVGDSWPVVVDQSQAGDSLPRRSEGLFQFSRDQINELASVALDPKAYGMLLGQALFQERVRDALMQARANSGGKLRLLLTIEDPALKAWHWERLCAPIRLNGQWDFLALDQQLLFSLYLPSLTDRRFPPIGRLDLRALVLVANPPEPNRYRLPRFNAEATAASIRTALGDIPHDLLANCEGATGPPTLNALCDRLSGQAYTLLHLVAYGRFRAEDGETVLYLLDETQAVKPVTATHLLERLDQLQGAKGLPHCAFLATCESAAPEAEAVGALGGLAQRLVRELGLPAVVAMTQQVSIATAQALAGNFYIRLREYGEVDRALVEAAAGLAETGDILVPALYSRLGGRPLFSDTEERSLADREIRFGLDRLEALLSDRAPILGKQFKDEAKRLRNILPTDRTALSEKARDEWEQALAGVNTLSGEVLDLNFRALALGQKVPEYDERCPFMGLAAFKLEDQAFFFGREALIAVPSSTTC